MNKLMLIVLMLNCYENILPAFSKTLTEICNSEIVFLNDTNRDVNYMCPYTSRCDAAIASGVWFTFGNGNRLPQKCPTYQYSCLSNGHYWTPSVQPNKTLPGPLNITLLYSNSSTGSDTYCDLSMYSITIRAAYCENTSITVYELLSVPICDIRYCYQSDNGNNHSLESLCQRVESSTTPIFTRSVTPIIEPLLTNTTNILVAIVVPTAIASVLIIITIIVLIYFFCIWHIIRLIVYNYTESNSINSLTIRELSENPNYEYNQLCIAGTTTVINRTSNLAQKDQPYYSEIQYSNSLRGTKDKPKTPKLVVNNTNPTDTYIYDDELTSNSVQIISFDNNSLLNCHQNTIHT